MAESMETTPVSATPASKKWYQSSGVLGGIGALLTSLLGVIVAAWPDIVTSDDAANLVANVPAAVTAGAAVIGSVVAIVGRVRAKKAITK